MAAPDQPCSTTAFNILEPIAVQLFQFIDQCHLDDQGAITSYSSELTDYNNPSCSTYDKIKGENFEGEKAETSSLQSNISPPISEETVASSLQVKDMYQETEDREPAQSEPIMMEDLENPFLFPKFKHFRKRKTNVVLEDEERNTSGMQRLTQSMITDKDGRREHESSKRGHQQYRGGRGRRQRDAPYYENENTSYGGTCCSYKQLDHYQSPHTAAANYPRNKRGGRNWSHQERGVVHRARGKSCSSRKYFPEHNELQSESPKKSTFHQKRCSTHNNSKSRWYNDPDSQCTQRQKIKQDSVHQQQPSPQPLHSQNMRSAHLNNVYPARNNTAGNFRNPRLYKCADLDDSFNHYEVSHFLWEGMYIISTSN